MRPAIWKSNPHTYYNIARRENVATKFYQLASKVYLPVEACSPERSLGLGNLESMA